MVEVRPGQRRRDIQGLRGIAVLLVVLYHAGLGLSGGFTGVDVFFVISGFVITQLITRELEQTRRFSFGHFYRRRAQRLLPGLAVMVVAVVLAGVLLAPVGSQRNAGETGVWVSGFLANAFLYRLGTGYFDVAATLDPFLHTWTLAVEEQFYLVFPAVIVVAWIAGGRRATTGAVAALAAGSFALSLVLSHGGALAAEHRPQQLAFYGSPTRAWEFGIGALLALGLPVLRRVPSRAGDALAVAGAAAIVYAAIVLEGTSGFPGLAALWPTLGAAAVIAGGSAGAALMRPALEAPPLVRLGDLSYSWYLWHWPAIVYARALVPGSGWAAPVAAALSLPVAAWSYARIENPIRRDRSMSRRRLALLIAVCIVVPAAASLGLVGASDALARTGAIAAWTRSRSPHLDARENCEGPTPLGRSSCTFRPHRPRGRIVLIGDSNASHFTEPVVHAGEDLRYTVMVATFYGCPLVDAGVIGSSAGEPRCRTFFSRSLRALVRMRPALAVLAARDDVYLTGPIDLRGGDGRIAHAPEAKKRVWEQGLRRTLAALARAHVPVAVVEPVPRLSQPDECAVVLVIADRCGGAVGRPAIDRELAPAVEVERRASRGLRDVHLLDLRSAFCTPASCSNRSDGRFLYFDSDHLSVDGSDVVTPRFRAAIARLAR